MSHIHLPDGLLPLWLWLAGYVVMGGLVAVLWKGGRATAEPRRFALLGIFAALMILVASIELPPLAYHINLSVVSGILLGPRLSVIAAFMVNTVLALLGHGGVTVIGLNTLVLSVEMIAGYGLFRLARRAGFGVRRGGFLATLLGLLLGTASGFGVIAAGAPWIDRVLRAAAFGPGGHIPGADGAYLDLSRLALLMFGFGAIGWLLEAALSAAILGYLDRLYPGLTGEEADRAARA